jgi:hypothetical protein
MTAPNIQTNHSINSSGSVASLAYSSALAPNSLMIVTVMWQGSQVGLPTVSGAQNGSFGASKVSFNHATYYNGIAIFALVNTQGAVSETINFSYINCGTISNATVVIDEFSGYSAVADGYNSQDQESYSSGTGATSSGNFTPLVNGDLIYAASTIGYIAGGSLTTYTHGTNFINTYNGPAASAGVQTEYYVQPTAAQIAGTFTTNTGVTFSTYAVAVALKKAALWLENGYWQHPPYQQ